MNDLLEQIEKLSVDIPDGLMDMMNARGDEVAGHCKRVALMACILARELGMPHVEVNAIAQSGLLHDIGKIVVPRTILVKKERLTAQEWQVVKSHSLLGYDILKPYAGMEKTSEIVYSHHERFDGTGYPRGLKGADICLEARMLAVLDTYDAIRSNRIYDIGRSVERAMREIAQGRGTQFDPSIVDAFLRCQPCIETCIEETKNEGMAGYSESSSKNSAHA